MSEVAKIGKAYGRGLAASGGLMLVMAMVFGLAMCVLPVCAGIISEDLIGPVFWCGFLSVPLTMLPAVLVGSLGWRFYVMRGLDQAFDAVGPGQMYMLSGRQWSGDHHGRAVHAFRVQHTLSVTLTGTPAHDLRVGRDNALARGAGRALGVDAIPYGDELLAYTKEGEAVLTSPGVDDAVATLLADDGRSLRSLHVDPNKGVTLSMRYANPGADDVDAWLVSMALLLEAAEG